MENDSSGDVLSDSEIIVSCEKELNKIDKTVEGDLECNKQADRGIRVGEKRKGQHDDNSEEGFTTITRRKQKRLVNNVSLEINGHKDKNNDESSEITGFCEVSVTSLANLPKPIAMAKLLRSENMKDILGIKYKSANKVFIQFQRKEDALKLLHCQKLKDIGLRCQLREEMSMSYGIVKGIDLELNEEELMSILKCSNEVISVKRLKRLNTEGKWIECEAIRVCFKSNTLPQHIYAYDCRFKVEPYVFPVTQCSGCWEFGHFIKYCPTKKLLCPKCGGTHTNCDIKDFKCLNCKGNHFVLDKTCPIFLKEKSIRYIMSKEQVTYKKALQLFMERKEKEHLASTETAQKMTDTQLTTTPIARKDTYRDILVTKALVHQNPVSEMEEEEQTETEVIVCEKGNTQNSKQKRRRRKIRSAQTKRDQSLEQSMDEDSSTSQKEKESYDQNRQVLYEFKWRKIWIKIKNIYKSKSKLKEKLLSVVKIVVEELKNFFVNVILGKDLLGFIQQFNRG